MLLFISNFNPVVVLCHLREQKSKERLIWYIHSFQASLMAQMVKNPPAMQETQVRSLGQEVPWRREWQPTPVFLPGEVHGQRSLADYSPWGCNESETTEQLVYIYITHIYISHICVCIEYIHTYVYIPFLCAPEINIINQLYLKKTQKVLFKHRINCVSHQSGDLVTQVSQPAW